MKRLVGILILLLLAGVAVNYRSNADGKREKAEDAGKKEGLALLEKALAAIQAKDRDGFREVTHFTADIEALKIEIIHRFIAEHFPDRFRLESPSMTKPSDLESLYNCRMTAQAGPLVGAISFSVIDQKITSLEISLVDHAPDAPTTPEP